MIFKNAALALALDNGYRSDSAENRMLSQLAQAIPWAWRDFPIMRDMPTSPIVPYVGMGPDGVYQSDGALNLVRHLRWRGSSHLCGWLMGSAWRPQCSSGRRLRRQCNYCCDEIGDMFAIGKTDQQLQRVLPIDGTRCCNGLRYPSCCSYLMQFKRC